MLIDVNNSWQNSISEPIGSAVPKFSQETKNLGFVRPLGATLSLLCAAQGFPIPAYRLVKSNLAFPQFTIDLANYFCNWVETVKAGAGNFFRPRATFKNGPRDTNKS